MALSRSQDRPPVAAPPRALTPADYLQKILTARVYDVAVETPLEPARLLTERLGNRVLLKREDTQPVFSFKLRAAPTTRWPTSAPRHWPAV